MSRRAAYWSVGLVPLVAVIAIVALAAGEEERPRAAARAAAEPTTSSPAVAAPEPERALVLVRRRGGLPPSWITRLRRSGAVEALAEDINASANPQGSEPRQDPRVVSAFEREGLTWGGRWPTAPDGMHFELHEDVSRGG